RRRKCADGGVAATLISRTFCSKRSESNRSSRFTPHHLGSLRGATAWREQRATSPPAPSTAGPRRPVAREGPRSTEAPRRPAGGCTAPPGCAALPERPPRPPSSLPTSPEGMVVPNHPRFKDEDAPATAEIALG